MASAADKRANALRERLAQQSAAQSSPAAATPAVDAARAHFVGATVLETLAEGRAVQAIPVGQIAPDLREGLRQPRRLPLPEELRSDGTWNEDERPLIDELLALGRSMQERQIQPIVVYRGVSTQYPAAEYLIVVGHRRWTAAVLVGMATIDAVVVDQLSPIEVLDAQYAENEDRAEFSDMERAWALLRMKQVLNDAPWEEVERRFRLSEARRKQLVRLTALSPEQQQVVARLRASETQLRPLHTAVREGTLPVEQADRVLQQITARATQQTSATDEERVLSSVDGATVARLVAQATRTTDILPAALRPKWVKPLQESLAAARKGLERLPGRVDTLDAHATQELLGELDQLLHAMTAATEALLPRVQQLEVRGDDLAEEG